jgi:hypothetical protein
MVAMTRPEGKETVPGCFYWMCIFSGLAMFGADLGGLRAAIIPGVFAIRYAIESAIVSAKKRGKETEGA